MNWDEHPLPEMSGNIADDLVALTEYLVETYDVAHHGGLGGIYGYGCDFDNDVFLLRPYCWCEHDDCLWCFQNDPDEPLFQANLTRLIDTFGVPWATLAHDDRPHAPNFFYKPLRLGIAWYKYIGRGMEYQPGIAEHWPAIFRACVESAIPRTRQPA